MPYGCRCRSYSCLLPHQLSAPPSSPSFVALLPAAAADDDDMARMASRTLPISIRSRLSLSPPISTAIWSGPTGEASSSRFLSSPLLLSGTPYVPYRTVFHLSSSYSRSMVASLGFLANRRGFRKVRRPQAAMRKQVPKDKQLQLDVNIILEKALPKDPEVLNIAEMLKLNVSMAMKIAFDGLKDSEYKTRDTSICDVGKFDKVELSVLLCNDEFIQNLNKEWRGKDQATDVLSMSQHIAELDLPVLILGDIIISVETASKQAEERGHTLLDEIRILMVHGLLHLLGFDHELSDDAEKEMENEERLVLKSLGWKGKGLIKSATDAAEDRTLPNDILEVNVVKDSKKAGSLRFYKPKFSYIFCDMDGTLLNSKSQITATTAEAIREAVSRGVKVVIATGKTRPAVISALKMVDLAGKNGVISEFSPGIFLQGLLVYGRQGREISRSNLDQDVCREALSYSLEHEVPVIAFCQDRCLTLFDHPLVDSLHTVYHEPKAEIIPSVKHLLAAAEIQKLLFFDTTEGISRTLRPYWADATKGRAKVVQAQPDMLEIVPAGTSKGDGVKILLNHLGVSEKEVMAIGDGENDIEMLQLASLGIALANGSEKAKAVANVIGASNDEDGVAKAIYEYAF
ncbi:endoribonuclease YBEY, chloroplastic-like [Zingiber officinale]|uniref:endoribonuclease YBEY, chloroplastic-like n=1 Tax=Zingiber officinale TaxID=94328 RepID=UPI001C4C645F|nr:endoribonuclease YBEY, chloroplastic-like [Zingiber officinale]